MTRLVQEGAGYIATSCTGSCSDECCQVLTGCGAGSGQLAAQSKRALLYKGTFLLGGVVTGG